MKLLLTAKPSSLDAYAHLICFPEHVIVGFPVLYKVLYSQNFKGRQPALLKEEIQTCFVNGKGQALGIVVFGHLGSFLLQNSLFIPELSWASRTHWPSVCSPVRYT